MVNSLKRLNNKQIIGLIIEVISFIGCCFNIDAFINWFWIGEGLKMFGSIYFIDLYSKEGKTWFKKLDKKRDKNLTRKPSELIFFLEIAETIIVSLVFVAEFVIKDFSQQFSTIMGIFIYSIISLIVILIVVERTYRHVDLLINNVENKKKKMTR